MKIDLETNEIKQQDYELIPLSKDKIEIGGKKFTTAEASEILFILVDNEDIQAVTEQLPQTNIMSHFKNVYVISNAIKLCRLNIKQ